MLLKHRKKILYSAIALYVIVITAASFWKYGQMRYNAIDLAYYNQVFWKTMHGDLFGLTIHPHISLGDHVEPIILFLAPFYALWPNARMLLFLQTLALALVALPIYSLSSSLMRREEQRRSAAFPLSVHSDRSGHGSADEAESEERKAVSDRAGGANVAKKDAAERLKKINFPLPLLFSLLWLTNPFVQNINLFEFHILPFALFPLFYALIAYEEKRMGKFLLWSLLALMVREDVALVIGAFGLLSLYDLIRKQTRGGIKLNSGAVPPLGGIPPYEGTGPQTKRWIITPFLLSLIWFFAAQKIAAYFAVGGAYKFLYYYAWLGNSFSEIVLNLVRHPLTVLAHIATANAGLLLLALGIPFLFLFLVRPRALLLTIPIVLQNLLARYGGTPLIAQTHYVTLLLPGLVLATITTLTHSPKFFSTIPVRFLLMVATLYGAVTLGPLPGVAMERVSSEELQTRATLLAQIPSDARVATTESFLTPLSRRNALYLLRYASAGKTQFDKAPYALPSDVTSILIDANDLVAYSAEDATRLHDILASFGVIAAQEQFFLLERGKGVPLFDAIKQKAPEARITNESPCSIPPLERCIRLTIVSPDDHNVFIVNDDTTQLLPLSFITYWFPAMTPITRIETGNATSVIALAPDRATAYQRAVTDRRNLQISRQ